MAFNPKVHHRRSIRLRGYDYSRNGAYFITVCAQNRACLFGEIQHDEMILNDAGWMIQRVWDEIPSHYTGVKTDAFIIMPNHIHGIIFLVGAGPCACPGSCACPNGQPKTGQPQGIAPTGNGPCACPNGQPQIGQPRGGAPTGNGHRACHNGMQTVLSLPDVVHRFKTMTTKRYSDGVKQRGWPPYPKKLWQRNYWEHIVRNENESDRIREYIVNNPATWNQDKLNDGDGICLI